MVGVLKALLAAAEDGHLDGLAYVIKIKPGDNRVGVAGAYRRRPELGLGAALKLQAHLMGDGFMRQSH